MILINAFDQIQTSYRNFPKLGIHLLKIKKNITTGCASILSAPTEEEQYYSKSTKNG